VPHVAYCSRLFAGERWHPSVPIQLCLSKKETPSKKETFPTADTCVMFLTVSTCALALCSTQIMSAYATLGVANFSSEIVLSPLARIQNEMATFSLKTIIRNSLPSPPALQAGNLDGYWILDLFSDATCTNFYYRKSEVLNTCVDVSGVGKDSPKLYRIITATATYLNFTLYADPACTTLYVDPEISDDDNAGGDSGSLGLELSSDKCGNSDGHSSSKSYYSASGDVATTLPIAKTK
jgi:hypothetical protein